MANINIIIAQEETPETYYAIHPQHKPSAVSLKEAEEEEEEEEEKKRYLEESAGISQ